MMDDKKTNIQKAKKGQSPHSKAYAKNIYTIGVTCKLANGDEDIKEWADVVGKKKSDVIKSMIRHAIQEGHFFGYED